MWFMNASWSNVVTSLLLALLMTATLSSTAHGMENTSCDEATAVAPEDDFHGYGDGARVFAVDVARAGILVVEAVTPVDATVEARLDLFDRYCRPVRQGGKGLTVTARQIAGMVVETETAGTLYFEVAPQDPRRTLEAYRLVTRWAEEPGRSGGLALKGVTDPDPDPDPEGLKACTDEGHGGLLNCATSVAPGETMAGALDGDDGDVFRFTLTRQRTVAIESFGSIDARAALYDRHGHRLAVDDDSGEGAGFRIVKTLAPGRYFARIEIVGGAEGVYELRVADVDR